MNALRRHPYFSLWIAVCVLGGSAEILWLKQLRQNSHRELANLAKKRQHREQLVEEFRLPVAGGGETLSDRRVIPIAPAELAKPRNSLDAFIAIAGAKEAMRRLAASDGVTLRPDESFGFAAYAHEGPGENDLGEVQSQLALTRLAIEKLFAAHPAKLLSIRREPLRNETKGEVRESTADFFRIEPRLDLRLPGLIEGRAVQLEFSGRTAALRTFLNSLATGPEPLMVRSVVVEPERENARSFESESRFSVVVQLVRPAVETGGEIGGQNTQALWTAPAASDLFDPSIPAVGAKTVHLRQAKESPLELGSCELLSVRREPYRLQLVGYHGTPDRYTGTFVSPGSPETWHARAGDRLETLGLTLKKISLERRRTERNPDAAEHELTACAEIWDEQKQETVFLVGHEWLMTDTPLAMLRFGSPAVRARPFRMGDVFREGGAVCRVEHIQFDPAEVVILKETSGPAASERVVLRPIATRSAKLSSAHPSK